MKIDKKTIDNILKLNDDQLWNVIKIIINKSGVKSVKNIEKPKDMSKIRNTLSSLNDEDIARAIELFKGVKNG